MSGLFDLFVQVMPKFLVLITCTHNIMSKYLCFIKRFQLLCYKMWLGFCCTVQIVHSKRKFCEILYLRHSGPMQNNKIAAPVILFSLCWRLFSLLRRRLKPVDNPTGLLSIGMKIKKETAHYPILRAGKDISNNTSFYETRMSEKVGIFSRHNMPVKTKDMHLRSKNT